MKAMGQQAGSGVSSCRIRFAVGLLVCVSTLAAVGCSTPRKPAFTKTYYIPEAAGLPLPTTQPAETQPATQPAATTQPATQPAATQPAEIKRPAPRVIVVIGPSTNEKAMEIETGSALADEMDKQMVGLCRQVESAFFRPKPGQKVDANSLHTFEAEVTYNFPDCKFDEKQLSRASLKSALTLGIADSSTELDATYACKLEMTVRRSDGKTKSYSAEGAATGKVSGDLDVVEPHAKLLFEADGKAMSELSKKIQADAEFWMPEPKSKAK